MHHHPITKPIQIQKPRLHRMSAPFPMLNNVAAPDPPPFFAQNLLARPLPTNSAWQNFVLKNGDQPEFIHPYLVQSARGALTICYPARVVHPAFIFQAFVANLIVSCASSGTHTITRFDDLSVTLKLPGPLTAPLVRGSPYITLIVEGGELKFSTIHAVLDVSASDHCTKHKILFNNGQTWVVYSSAPLKLNPDLTVSDPFQGILRIAALSDKFDQVAEADQKEQVLDRFRTSYPVSGHVELHTPFRVCYKWKKKGWGDLLMLSHSVHRQILSLPGTDKVYPEFRYRSMDGDLVGIAGDSWVLEETPISISWYSVNGFQSQEEIQSVISALEQDVAELSPINTSSTYFYGKAIARAARLALIAEETHSLSLIPRVRDYLEDSITPWLDGSFQGNGFGYDNKWGGLISQDGSRDSGADFGLGVYNDHHYHFGYFCYAIAVLAKLDHNWARRFKSQVYAIVEDFMSLEEGVMYPRLRNFDLWKLHSWASGITEFADGRNQESTSEALNAYYSAALLGLVYGDANLIGIGSTLAALEIRSAKAWWHVPLNSTVYESEFVEQNRVMGVLWANKRDSGLWFAPAEWRECRLGIQLLPILPITELLFSDVGFVKELVEWTVPALGREGVGEGWKGFVYALESMYDKDGALQKVKTLKGYDDGNSLSNLLWWICTRGNKRTRLHVPEDCLPVQIEEDKPHDFYQEFLSFKECTQLELQRLATEIRELKNYVDL